MPSQREVKVSIRSNFPFGVPKICRNMDPSIEVMDEPEGPKKTIGDWGKVRRSKIQIIREAYN